MTVLEAVEDMLRSTYQQGKWTDGQRFFVQVRAYLGSQGKRYGCRWTRCTVGAIG